MAAPRHVPTPALQKKFYKSTRRKQSDRWVTGRPGEQKSVLQRNSGFGNQGPDQGYALKIVQYFRDKVYLTSSEEWSDAAEAAVIVGLKRASLFGRAPSRYDLEAAFCIWGFFDPEPDSDLVELRFEKLRNVGATHNYLLRRAIADSVPPEALREELEKIQENYDGGWQSMIDISIFQKAEIL
tara:strand:- start:6 stop:554 length:549 start_codon:yes stop_codon:yes gene_type:complete